MINFTRIKAIIKKEFIQIIRDPRSLGIAIAMPMIFLILFGYALTLDVDEVAMAIWDQDKSHFSEDFILDFKNSRYFKIISYADNYRQLENYINKNKVYMGLVIPKYFSKHIKTNKPAPVQLLVDGSDSNTAFIALGYVSAVIGNYNNRLLKQYASTIGQKIMQPIDVRYRIWFNSDLKSKNFIIPGLIAVIMMIIAAFLTSLTIAREWERGTMEQLISTPISANELIIGKLIPYFVIGFSDMLIAVGMGQFLFNVPLRGNLALLFFISSIFLGGALGLGMLVSITTKSQLLASQMAMLATFLPAFLLSGFMYPITNMPKAIQIITYFIPARYFISVLKGIYLKGIGIKELAIQLLFLSFFFGIILTIANLKFKKKVV